MTAKSTQVGGSHYAAMKIQPVEFIHANGIGYLEGNVIKYVCRHRNKNGRQDIEKAIHYLQLLLEAEYPAEHIYKGCRRCEGYAMCVCPPKQPDPI